MTRIKISIGILCLLIIMSIFSGIWIDNRCKKIIESINTVSSYAEKKDIESAKTAVAELEKIWSDFRVKASIIIKNEKLSEIDRISSRISYLLKNKSDELDSELKELKSMIELLKNSEIPILTSVL